MIRVLPAVAVSPASPGQPGGRGQSPSLTSWLLSSLMVIGLILVLGFLLQEEQALPGDGRGQMKVIATLPLATRRS